MQLAAKGSVGLTEPTAQAVKALPAHMAALSQQHLHQVSSKAEAPGLNPNLLDFSKLGSWRLNCEIKLALSC